MLQSTSPLIVKITKKDLKRAQKPTRWKLYHGTSALYAPSIARQGLLPRSATNNDNYAEQGLPSIADHVYLALKEYLFSGIVAAMRSSSYNRIAVVEVDLDLLDFGRMYPNEDCIWDVLTREKHPLFVGLDAVEGIRLACRYVDANQDLWFDYLSDMMTVAHRGGIPLRAITRISIFEPTLILADLFYEKQSTARFNTGVIDPLSDESYQIIQRWMFGGGLSADRLETMRRDAAEKGYPLSHLALWERELEFMNHDRPAIFRVNHLSKDDRKRLNRLAEPVKVPRLGVSPLLPTEPQGIEQDS